MNLNEADTCRKYVLPKLLEWDKEPHFLTEQYYIDAGRILIRGGKSAVVALLNVYLRIIFFVTLAIFL